MSTAIPPGRSPFAALRGFIRPRPPAERCELCSLALPSDHQHLLDLTSRQLVCSCDPCAILFSSQQNARFRKVPRTVQVLAGFRMTDAQWDSLLIPINIAFFLHNTVTGKVVALYPGPAGVTESLLTLEAWQTLVEENPILCELEPDVEALLVNRLRDVRAYYRVPIDECYKLVGLIRKHWRGLSGGLEVWEEIGQFFAQLKERAHA
jgi:Family of unknown function (DUF5947)